MDSQAPAHSQQDQRPVLRGTLIFFIVLGTVMVAVRVGTQLKLHRRLFWDDMWILLSLVSALGSHFPTSFQKLTRRRSRSWSMGSWA